jgi:hypothetical protein
LTPEEADKKMHELLDSSIESLADIVHTKDGSAVARELLARGVAKDRKNILRVLKPHLEKLCQDAEAQMVLFTAFDVVDDTKMMAKAILAVSTSPLYSAIFSKVFFDRISELWLLLWRYIRLVVKFCTTLSLPVQLDTSSPLLSKILRLPMLPLPPQVRRIRILGGKSCEWLSAQICSRWLPIRAKSS